MDTSEMDTLLDFLRAEMPQMSTTFVQQSPAGQEISHNMQDLYQRDLNGQKSEDDEAADSAIIEHVLQLPEDLMTVPYGFNSQVGSKESTTADTEGKEVDKNLKEVLDVQSPTCSSSMSRLGPKQEFPLAHAGTHSRCSVCTKPCEKRVFYGAVTCHSCRVFFRRAMQNNKYQGYQCLENGACRTISATRWSRCQMCRFTGCLQAGMAVAGMAKLHPRLDNGIGQLPLLRRPADVVCLEEKILVKGMFNMHLKCQAELFFDHVTNDPNEVEDLLNDTSNGGEFPINVKVPCLEELVMEQGRRFFEQMSDMQRLPKKDRDLLLSVNFPAALEFLIAMWIKEASSGSQYNLKIRETFETFFRQAQDEPSKMDKYRLGDRIKLVWSGQNNHSPASSRTCNCTSGCECQLDGPYMKEFTPQQKEIYDRMGEDSGDVISVMLVMLMIMYSSDGLMDLQNRDTVDGIRTKFAHMLHRYLRETGSGTGQERRRFRRAVYMVAFAREANEIKKEKERERIRRGTAMQYDIQVLAQNTNVLS